jgi:hypothetical protein
MYKITAKNHLNNYILPNDNLHKTLIKNSEIRLKNQQN